MTPPTFPKGRRALTTVMAGALCAAWTTVAAGKAHAYTISSFISSGCHEDITTDALRAVRLELPNAAAPLPADRNERALIDDLEFVPPSDMTDLGAATLLVGVRDNDLKGRDSNDLSQLALVHGDPSAQREHCLRNAHENEPGGSAMAVLDCRAFVRERILQALEGLDATGAPDATKRTTLPLYLSLRHTVTASLPTYYLRIGQAIHAIEDSFTHTYRSADGMQITVVLDWVDEANGSLVEMTDGPPHASDLDHCDNPDDLRQQRRVLATEAAAAVLRATLDPTQTNEQKMVAVEGVLDTYLTYSVSPVCTFDNNWCQAPEHLYGNGQGIGSCSVGGPDGRTSVLGGAVILGLGLFSLARRPRRRRGRIERMGAKMDKISKTGKTGKTGTIGIAALVLASVVTMSRAFAAEPDAPVSDVAASPEHAPPPPTTTPVTEPGPRDPSVVAMGAYLGGSGSFNYKALATTLGARMRFSKHWTFGLDAEWNPWIAVNGTTTMRAGAFNGYGTAILRVPLTYEQFNLRITGSLGVSRLLMDLYGAPKGSTGIYAGFSPLGLEWKMSGIFYLILNPLNIAVPTPQLSGVPFSYPQYRATIGIEAYAG